MQVGGKDLEKLDEMIQNTFLLSYSERKMWVSLLETRKPPPCPRGILPDGT